MAYLRYTAYALWTLMSTEASREKAVEETGGLGYRPIPLNAHTDAIQRYH